MSSAATPIGPVRYFAYGTVRHQWRLVNVCMNKRGQVDLSKLR
jgi:hypothetical protein